MKTYWLRLAKPCTLELPKEVKDYAGQRLVFRPRDGIRRCVREDVFNHPIVQRYLAARYIELEDTSAKAAPPPRPAKPVAPVVEPTPEPVLPISEVVAADEVGLEVAEDVAEPVALAEAEAEVSEEPAAEPSSSDSEPETRKKRKKSRRYE